MARQFYFDSGAGFGSGDVFGLRKAFSLGSAIGLDAYNFIPLLMESFDGHISVAALQAQFETGLLSFTSDEATFTAPEPLSEPLFAESSIAAFELSSLLAENGGDGTLGFVLNGIDGDDFSGISVSTAGDINGDGFDDILIGAPFADPNNIYSGETYVVFGSDSGFGPSFELSSLLQVNGGDGAIGFVINGIAGYDRSGSSVSSAGDINGDGFDDILIGARGPFNGESYIVFGHAAGFAPSFELSSLRAVNGEDGTDGFVINGGFSSGYSVANAGDVNGDGFDDILIGAQSASPNGVRSGESYIVFGREAGFAASLELSSLLAVNGGDGTDGFVINGIDAEDSSGRSVSSAGDINGDGFDDILIGAWRADPNGGYSGESYIVFGREAGFAPSLELSSLDGQNGFVINGIGPGGFSGFSVASAGDINGDGFDDILIGAHFLSPNGRFSGQSYLIFGRDAAFEASFELSSLLAMNGGDGTSGFVINGIEADDYSGRSVASAGDVNNDGFDDILIGARYASPNGERSGQSYVILGREAPFTASFELSSLDGHNGFVINGIDERDNSGVSVASAGDIDGDGFDDILIGADGNDPYGRGNAGESYIIYGQASFGRSVETLTPSDDNYRVLGQRDFLGEVVYGLAGDDRITGASGHDLLYGGAGNDTLTGGSGNDRLWGDAGQDRLFSGAGDDILYGGAGDDILSAQSGSNILEGGEGNDTLYSGSGADHIDGGAGIDRLLYSTSAAGVIVDLQSGIGTGGSAEGDSFANIENLYGSQHDDYLSGDLGDNVIVGLNGDDTLIGFDGNDRLIGGQGDDALYGDGGDDVLLGQSGADHFIFGALHGEDRIVDFEQGVDLIAFQNDPDAISFTGPLSFSDLVITQMGAHVLITSSAGTITLNNTVVSDFDASDFSFQGIGQQTEAQAYAGYEIDSLI